MPLLRHQQSLPSNAPRADLLAAGRGQGPKSRSGPLKAAALRPACSQQIITGSSRLRLLRTLSVNSSPDVYNGWKPLVGSWFSPRSADAAA